MKSIFKTLMISTAIILVNGCGGGGSSSSITDSITDRNYIIIMHDIISGVCDDPLFENLLVDNGFVNPLAIEADNSASCATYGRDSSTCAEDSIVNYDPTLIGDVACVVGFDDFIQVAKVSNKVVNASYQDTEVKPSLLEATDSIQTSFIQISE